LPRNPVSQHALCPRAVPSLGNEGTFCGSTVFEGSGWEDWLPISGSKLRLLASPALSTDSWSGPEALVLGCVITGFLARRDFSSDSWPLHPYLRSLDTVLTIFAPQAPEMSGPLPRSQEQVYSVGINGWGGRDRTSAWRNQNPLPYRLATPQVPGFV
jgi:hypothetical protein